MDVNLITFMIAYLDEVWAFPGMEVFVGRRVQWVTVGEYLSRSRQGEECVLIQDGEFLRVRGDLEEGGAGHHVREGADCVII